MILVVLGAMGCASQRNFEENPPFMVSDPAVQTWVGGREESGSGTEIRMRWTPEDPSAIRPDTLYFRGRALLPEVRDTETGMMLVASYVRTAPANPDRIMHADSTREVGNQPPMPLPAQGAIPFELERNEAVLGYTRLSDGRRFYYRIKDIKEKPAKALPGRPRQ